MLAEDAKLAFVSKWVQVNDFTLKMYFKGIHLGIKELTYIHIPLYWYFKIRKKKHMTALDYIDYMPDI